MKIVKLNTNDKLASDFLGPLAILLKRGEVAHKNYISNGKKFLYAKIIKDNNESIRHLVLSNAHMLPENEQSNAIDLISHIDIWSVLWEDLDNRKRHCLDDEFSFENEFTFPRKSVDSLSELYLELINK